MMKLTLSSINENGNFLTSQQHHTLQSAQHTLHQPVPNAQICMFSIFCAMTCKLTSSTFYPFFKQSPMRLRNNAVSDCGSSLVYHLATADSAKNATFFSFFLFICILSRHHRCHNVRNVQWLHNVRLISRLEVIKAERCQQVVMAVCSVIPLPDGQSKDWCRERKENTVYKRERRGEEQLLKKSYCCGNKKNERDMGK